jgi:hypothetical protein
MGPIRTSLSGVGPFRPWRSDSTPCAEIAQGQLKTVRAGLCQSYATQSNCPAASVIALRISSLQSKTQRTSVDNGYKLGPFLGLPSHFCQVPVCL